MLGLVAVGLEEVMRDRRVGEYVYLYSHLLLVMQCTTRIYSHKLNSVYLHEQAMRSMNNSMYTRLVPELCKKSTSTDEVSGCASMM